MGFANEIRKERMRCIMGLDAPGRLFSVFVEFSTYYPSSHEQDKSIREKFDLSAGQASKLPRQQVCGEEFNTGRVDAEETVLNDVQHIFTSDVYPSHLFHRRNLVDVMGEDVERVKGSYKRVIKQKLPHFRSIYESPETGLYHNFRFEVRDALYDFDRFPPSVIGKAQPCTIIPGVEIDPEDLDLT